MIFERRGDANDRREQCNTQCLRNGFVGDGNKYDYSKGKFVSFTEKRCGRNNLPVSGQVDEQCGGST